MTTWLENKLKEYEKVFNDLFNPENLFGYYAILYDEALAKSNHFGTTWQDEMRNMGNYFDFVVDYLENEGIYPDEFSEN